MPYVENPQSRPTVNTKGAEDNALMLLNRCREAAKKAGWTATQVDHFLDEIKDGDHDNMRLVVNKYFEVK